MKPSASNEGLNGRTVLITRARGQERELCEKLCALGARAVHVPTIAVAEPDDWTAVDEAIARFDDYDWLVLTSPNAVDVLMERAGGVVANGRVKIAVVGSQTARRLEKRGVEPDLIPAHFRAEGILDVLPLDLTGVRILFPRAEVAGERLPSTLRERGAAVDVVTVYRTVVPEEGGERLRTLFETGEIDCVVFTSGSTARNLITMLGGADAVELVSRADVAVMGPVTWEAVRQLGLDVAIEPPTAKVAVLVDSIRRYYS